MTYQEAINKVIRRASFTSPDVWAINLRRRNIGVHQQVLPRELMAVARVSTVGDPNLSSPMLSDCAAAELCLMRAKIDGPFRYDEEFACAIYNGSESD